jgi:hypothetical protein
MIEREVTTDITTNPPMIYLVAAGCPKVTSGQHKFYACVCGGPSIVGKDLLIACTAGDAQHIRDAECGKRFITCHFPNKFEAQA